jgi:hypothetical protein
VFKGNTQDAKTFGAQVKKASERFGCERVTFVGDRGMIKSGQVEELAQVGFHYITAITKPQIETLLKAGVLQMELFSVALCEVEEEGCGTCCGGIRGAPKKSPIPAPTNAPAWSGCARSRTAIWPSILAPR